MARIIINHLYRSSATSARKRCDKKILVSSCLRGKRKKLSVFVPSWQTNNLKF